MTEAHGVRARLHRADGTVEDVSDRVSGSPGFFDSLRQPTETPHRLTMSGWQRCDDAHPPGTGRAAYRVVYKTMRLVPVPQVAMTWPNLRVVFANGDVERGGVRVPGGIAGRTATHVVIPEFGRIVDTARGVSYLPCVDPTVEVAGWEETVEAVSYVELIYVLDVPDSAGGGSPDVPYDDMLIRGRAGVATLKTLLDLAFGPRLLAMPLAEEVGETFDDWHWNRLLSAGLFSVEAQATLRPLDGYAAVEGLQPVIEHQQALDPAARKRLRLASQWYWRADADTDPTTRFVAWWLCIESLEMDKAGAIRPVRDRLADLTAAPVDVWMEPVGRLYGLRSKIVHGEVDDVPPDAATLVELIARALLHSRFLGSLPDPLQAELTTAAHDYPRPAP